MGSTAPCPFNFEWTVISNQFFAPISRRTVPWPFLSKIYGFLSKIDHSGWNTHAS